jgi:archaellum component FlaF (FlaF/FlaG flagellin family)
MALSDTSKTLISIKKLVGKAHTSNDKDVANEGVPSGLTISSNTVFGQTVPTTANQTNDALYAILTGSGIAGDGQVEYLRLQASFIAGSDTASGRHGFELKLPADYETNSKNPLAGTYPFKNNQSINITSGSLQLIPPSFASEYEVKPFSGGNTAKDNGTQIPVLDARDWSLDYFNGVFFQQDPPGAGDHADNPDHVQAYLYVGKYSDQGMFATGLSGSLTQLVDGTSYLTAGTGISVISASNGSVGISSRPQKFVYEVTASHGSSQDLHITAADFSQVSFEPARVDVFVNGQLMTSGTTKDYILSGHTQSIRFYFGLITSDIISVRTY